MGKFYPCVYCTEDGYCKKYSDDEVTSWCVQGPCKDEKPSNADRIRTMSDEEMARLFTGDWCEIVCGSPAVCDGNCEKNVLAWLEQEARDAES